MRKQDFSKRKKEKKIKETGTPESLNCAARQSTKRKAENRVRTQARLGKEEDKHRSRGKGQVKRNLNKRR